MTTQRPRRVLAGPLVALLAACSGSAAPDGGVDTPQPSDITQPTGDSALDAAAGSDVATDAPAGTDVTPRDVAAPTDAGASDPLDPALAPAVDMNPASYPANVWVTGPLVKVQPSATPGAVHWALVSAARNEFESFQVHVRATTAAINLNVTVSDLTDARSGDRITAATNVTVSREAYLNITQLSDANGTLGMTPDPLIPAVDPIVHEARNAFPAMVPMGQTRSAWIDLLVPRAAHSGYYTGTVTVSDGATVLARLPLRVKVWDFELPSTATLRSMFGMSWNGMCVQAFGGYNNCGRYPGAAGDNDRGTELTHVANATLFLNHRTTVSDVIYAAPTNTDWTRFDATYGPLFNGTAATLLPGAQITAIRYSQGISDASSVQRWVTHFRATGWLDRLFEYHCDEPPNGCSWATSLSEAQGIHTASADMHTLLTANIANATTHGLLDAIDILVPVVDEMHPRRGTDQRATYDAWLMRPNKHLFWYQSCDEHESCSNGTAGTTASTWPSYMVDASPVRNRIFQWMAYLYRVEGELYYASDYCWTAACGGGMDPWASVYAFGGNGDGTLFYPGLPARIGGTTPVPVSSIRLVHIRDGMEDFEYLHALAAAGDDAFAQSTSRAFITNASTFDNDPARLAAAREALGDRLHHRVHP